MITFDEYIDEVIKSFGMDIKYVYERKFLARWLRPHYQQLVALDHFKKEMDSPEQKYDSLRRVKYEPVHIKSSKFLTNRKRDR